VDAVVDQHRIDRDAALAVEPAGVGERDPGARALTPRLAWAIRLEDRMDRSVRTTLTVCLALAFSAAMCAAAEVKSDGVNRTCHTGDKAPKCRTAPAPRRDPELGIHGFIGAGPVGGFVGSQGQAGYNW